MAPTDHREAIQRLPDPAVLVADIRIERAGAEVVLHVPGIEEPLALGPNSGDFADHVFPLLDGRRSLSRVAEALAAEFDTDSLLTSFGALADRGILVEGAPPTGPVHGLRVYRMLRAAERRWIPELARALEDETPELAAGIEDPARYRRWYRGWWAENLHFVANAAKKFGLTAHRFDDHEGLTEFFLEEHDHALIFRKGAVELGLDPDLVMRAPPLAEMAALNAFILHGCKRQPLFLAWIADQVERAQRSYMKDPLSGRSGQLREELSDRMADAPGFLELVFRHADVEQAAAHGSYGRDMFEATPVLSAAAVAELLELAAVSERLFLRKEQAVYRWYGQGEATPPQPARNRLAALSRADPSVALGEAVERITAEAVGRLPSGGPTTERLTADVAALVRAWANAAAASPALALHFDLRFALTRLAVGLRERTRAAKSAPASRSVELLGLAAFVEETCETDPVLALAQAAFLEGVLQALLPGALAPLTADLPAGPASPLEALAAQGPVHADLAQAVGVQLQVLEDQIALWLRSAT